MTRSISEGAIVMDTSKKRIHLDRINRVMLQILVEDARTPLSRIASVVRLSKAGVLKRINRLIEDGVIIDFIAITNPLAWGYRLYFVLFSTDASTEEDDISVIRRCPFVWWFVRLGGGFNFQLALMAKDSNAFYKTWGGLARKLNVRDLRIMELDWYQLQPYEILGVKSGLPMKSEKYYCEPLDKTDAILLDALRFDSRESILGLSRKTGLGVDCIKRRLGRLYGRGAIQRYFTNFDIFSAGFIPYMLFLKMSDTSRKDALKRYLLDSKHSNGVFSLSDEWAIGCMVEFQTIQDLRVFLSSLTKAFPEIMEYQTMLMLDQIICDMFPKGVFQEVIQ